MKITKETRETVGSLLGAVAGFVLFYWLGGFITPRVNFILWCYLAVWLFWGKSSSTDKEEKYVMRERLCSVEKALQKLDQQYAYKMEVSVWPDWDEIFTKLYGSKKWHDEFDEETKKEYHDPAKAGRGIADKIFRFVEFFDSSNYGLGMLWSDHDKSFVDDYEVRGSILPADSLAARKMIEAMEIEEHKHWDNSAKTLPRFRVSPSGICSDPYPHKDGEKFVSLPVIPFEQIKKAIINAAKQDRFSLPDMQEVLQKDSAENDIEYRRETPSENCSLDEYLRYRSRPDEHVFKNKYYQLRIRLTMADRPRFYET